MIIPSFLLIAAMLIFINLKISKLSVQTFLLCIFGKCNSRNFNRFFVAN